MHSTGATLVGLDKSSGRLVRRRVYEDQEGNEYVRLGSYALDGNDACVSVSWFCDNILMDGMLRASA